MNDVLKLISGADSIVAYFGKWPCFHDAEVLTISLSREQDSIIDIAFGESFSTENCVGGGVIRLHLQELFDAELSGFNHQNVLSELEFQDFDGGLALVLHSSFGVSGVFKTASVSVELVSGV